MAHSTKDRSTTARVRAIVEQHLSQEDREILRLLVECNNDETIARRLMVSVRTVRRRIARIMDLLQAENRFAAGVAAATLELLAFPCSEASIEMFGSTRPAAAPQPDRATRRTLRMHRA